MSKYTMHKEKRERMRNSFEDFVKEFFPDLKVTTQLSATFLGKLNSLEDEQQFKDKYNVNQQSIDRLTRHRITGKHASAIIIDDPLRSIQGTRSHSEIYHEQILCNFLPIGLQLYVGKRKDNDEIVQGDLIIDDHTDSTTHYMIRPVKVIKGEGYRFEDELVEVWHNKSLQPGDRINEVDTQRST